MTASQTTVKMIAYRLYGAVLDGERVREAERERYCFIGMGYILIYRRKLRRAKPGWKEMRDLTVLPPAAAEWLRQSNMEILEEFAERHAEDARSGKEQFLERFERELEAEARRLREKDREGEKETCE